METEELKEARPLPGTRYYRYLNDQLIEIRLKKIKNDNCYVVEIAGGIEFKMSKAEFKTYTKLMPDGYTSFVVGVLEDGVKDVIVTFHRKQDITTKEQIPFATCRMNIYDIFTNTINKEEGVMYIGCSVNIDSCPSDIDYHRLRICNGFEASTIVSTYIEDTLDDILRYVNPLPYNDVLYVLNLGYNSPQNTIKTRGVCKDLRMLLTQNHFIDDVYYGFKELKVQFEYIEEIGNQFIPAIEDVIKHEMINPVWVPFSRDIDLSKIEDSYLIIRDSANKLYIVSYKEGEYINRPYFNDMDDHTEYEVLKNLAQNK